MTDHYCEECGCGPILCECPIHFEVGNSRALRPAPELPEGYREECRYGSACLIHGEGGVVAWIGDVSGSLFLATSSKAKAEHLPALAIWLQKRTNNTTGEKQ